MFVYICLGYYEWIDFKNSRENLEKDKEAICFDEFGNLDYTKYIWIVQQIQKRLDNECLALNPIYCFLEKPTFRLGPAKHVVCKVRIDPKYVVYFNDTLYVYFLNSRECEKNFERMFSRPTNRAFIPYITRSMVRKVWVYRNDKRLRSK